MKDTQNYVEGYQLAADEYLLKIRTTEYAVTGFLSKFNQNGTIPVKFKGWGRSHPQPELPILIFTEKFRSGWKLDHWRIGQSQEWASLMHPYGFTLEIYLDNFLEIVKTCTIIEGEIQGNFKWESNKLIKE